LLDCQITHIFKYWKT